jgi:hypothetical protein
MFSSELMVACKQGKDMISISFDHFACSRAAIMWRQAMLGKSDSNLDTQKE